ncbi:MAG: 5-aminolevulinate synthase [Alphaproteobacteria bacterium]
MDYNKFFSEQLDALKQDNNYRQFKHIRRIKGKYPLCEYMGENGDVKEITMWCSNDYMAMGENETVGEKMIEVLKDSSTGAGGTRNIAGTTVYHSELENTISKWMGKQSSLIFTSGWVANLTILATLGEKLQDCIIYSDAMNHNSMIEGIRRSRAIKRVFKHNDTEDLERLIKQDDPNVPKIIAFESVYSMNGNISPIKEIIKIAKKYNCLTYLDEVHAIGLYGDTGAGVAEELGVLSDIDIIQGTMGKAVGQVGGFMASSEKLVDFVRSFGNGFIFTTSLPPVVVAGANESIKHLQGARQERTKLHAMAKHIKQKLSADGFEVMQSDSHIIPIFVGDAKKCTDISKHLIEKHNIYVQSINYPTVAKGTERLRISPSPVHSEEMVEKLSLALQESFASC